MSAMTSRAFASASWRFMYGSLPASNSASFSGLDTSLWSARRFCVIALDSSDLAGRPLYQGLSVSAEVEVDSWAVPGGNAGPQAYRPTTSRGADAILRAPANRVFVMVNITGN